MPRVRALATIAAGGARRVSVLKVADLFLHGGWGPLLAGTWESWLYLAELIRHGGRAGVSCGAALVAPLSGRDRRGRRCGGCWSGNESARCRHIRLCSRCRRGVLPVVDRMGGQPWRGRRGRPGVLPCGREPADIQPNSRQPRDGTGQFRLSYGSLRQFWNTALTDSLHRVTLIAVFVIPLAFVLMYPPFFHHQAAKLRVRPAVVAMDVERAKLRIDADDNGVVDAFPPCRSSEKAWR